MPDKIHILDEKVANQIAAGEVVERPASVLKELVENSLDAAATAINVDIEEAGRRMIRVSDDGFGMSKTDLLLSVKRHATSKIQSESELEAIRSFGFRGEALPSIASVSKFSISSRNADAPAAQLLEMIGGKEIELKETSHAKGTTVEVRDLFFNTPARLKFLKNASTEIGRIQQDLIRLALPHPGVSFKLRLDGRLSIDFPKAPSLKERVAQVLGGNFLDEALELEGGSGLVRVSGWIARPKLSRSNRTGQHLFINRRAVEHRLLGFTLSQAYGSLLAHGRHAVAVLFVELAEGDVDVNVHPAKREVRFKDERLVLDSLRHSVQRALSKASLMATYSLPHTPTAIGEAAYLPQNELSPASWGEISAPGPHQAPSTWAVPSSIGIPAPRGENEGSWPVPLAQLHRSYLLCQEKDALVVVDQHAAHERVLYESFCKSLEAGEVKSQQLLLPQKLGFGPSQAQRLRPWMATLASMGLELNDFGADIFYVQSIPAFLKNVQVSTLIQDLLDEIGEEIEKDPLGAFRREVAAQMACRAAIKAGDPLTLEEMQRLMADLSRCEIPWSCPHGRPPFVRLPLHELEKYFDRR